MNWLGLKHLEFSGLQMKKKIYKAFFLLIAITATVPVFAQSYLEAVTAGAEATKARAEAGDATAQYNLGVMYSKGEGVAQNDQEAVKWYRLAAEQGHSLSQTILRYSRLSAFEIQPSSREYFIDGLVMILTESKVIKCDQGGYYSIDITGDIGPDSSFAIEKLLDESPNCVDRNGVIVSRTTVILSSAGGLLEDGYKMGQLFRANGVHTQVNDESLCASSCAVAYLGGVDRTMGEDAVIMFHSPYFYELNSSGERVPNCDLGSESSAKLLSYYQEMTSNEEGQRLMDRTLSYCSADDGWVLKGANSAELFGVVTKL